MIMSRLTQLRFPSAEFLEMVGRYVLYGAAIVAGAALFFWLRAAGVVSAVVGGLAALLNYLYVMSGIVVVGLVPLTIALAVLAVAQVGYHAGWWHFKGSHVRKYELIESSAPILGLLGTMLGLWDALEGLDVSKGLQAAIQNMSVGVGQALGSSVYGLILALIAYTMKHIYSARLSGEEV